MSGAEAVSVRRTAWVVLVLGAAAFVALAWALIPWHPYPGGPLDLPDEREVFTPDELERMLAYSGTARWISRTALVVSLLVSCLLGFTSLGRRMVARLPGPWLLRVVLAVALVTLVGWLATLPFGVAIHRLQMRYGLSRQPWGPWLGDSLLNQAVGVVTTSLALLALFACIRFGRRRWPAVAAGLVAALVVVGSFVYPVVIEPLFNDFEPLPRGQLRTEVMKIADREGVELDDVLVVDASRRTTALNAYVTGFGSTRRVVLYDNLVDSQRAAAAHGAVLSVVAHELAHAKHDDVLVGTVIGAAGAVAAVGLLGVLSYRRQDRYATPEGIPMLLAVFALASVLAMPVQNGLSRQVETRADVDALHATEDLESFTRLQHDLGVRSLSDPSPQDWSQWWFGSHPTALQRIAIARRVLGD
ncbi:STE24 endopeptidase [Nocardioides luteus]|uniref:M48 family metallopeptidase n=1 Tax=Nocardioides luteus TaxID=1844 RepID=UPI00166A8BCC|nr:M48 family metallopeptidase [Nocardioides luteus]MDR7309946.1 STE24 endopeptidase [Nocardioides luteus]GGR59429.1 Ste24 endopeptidase [Nocardioides luteus]